MFALVDGTVASFAPLDEFHLMEQQFLSLFKTLVVTFFTGT